MISTATEGAVARQVFRFLLMLSAGFLLVGPAMAQDRVVGGDVYYVLRGNGFSTGQVPSYGAVPEFFSDLFYDSGLDILVDMELYMDEGGVPLGMVVLDGFGAEFTIGAAPEYEQDKRPYWFDLRDPRLIDPLEDPSLPPEFVFPAAVSIQWARDDAGSTDGNETPYRPARANEVAGYYILDNYGGIHLVNNNLPNRQPVFEQPAEMYDIDPYNIFFRKYAEYASGLNPYWGFDVARDLEISVNFSEASGGQTNGYFILDKAGAVHTCLGGGNPAPWQNEPRPYFVDGNGNPLDVAVDFEVTPRQDGYVLLDKYGNLFFVGSGARQYRDNEDIPNRFTPAFGEALDIMVDLELTTYGAQGIGLEDGFVTGLYVMDKFGVVYTAGLAPFLGGPTPPAMESPFYRDMEVSPAPRAVTDAVQNGS